MYPKVFIVLVNWNGWANSIECISSLLCSNYTNYEIVLVDNDSSDHSIEIIKDWVAGNLSLWVSPSIMPGKYSSPSHDGNISYCLYVPSEIESVSESSHNSGLKLIHQFNPKSIANFKLHLISAKKNGGFGAGNNLALKLIQLKDDVDYIWLLNNDTVVTPNSMSEMVACAQENKGIVGATLLYYHDPDKVQAYGGGYFSKTTGMTHTENHKQPKHLEFINGASFMFGTEILHSVGNFDENIFLYYEEFDYCFRASRRGYGCFLSDAIVYHKHGASSSNADDSFAWQHVLKNKPYVLKKNFGYGLWVLFYVLDLLISALGFVSSRGKIKASRTIVAEWFKGFFGSYLIALDIEKLHK